MIPDEIHLRMAKVSLSVQQVRFSLVSSVDLPSVDRQGITTNVIVQGPCAWFNPQLMQLVHLFLPEEYLAFSGKFSMLGHLASDVKIW